MHSVGFQLHLDAFHRARERESESSCSSFKMIKNLQLLQQYCNPGIFFSCHFWNFAALSSERSELYTRFARTFRTIFLGVTSSHLLCIIIQMGVYLAPYYKMWLVICPFSREGVRPVWTVKSLIKRSVGAMPKRRNGWNGSCCRHSRTRASSSWPTGSRSEARSRDGPSCGAY